MNPLKLPSSVHDEMTRRLVDPLDKKQRDELLCLLTKVVGANERR
jgi:hypothetical protein